MIYNDGSTSAVTDGMSTLTTGVISKYTDDSYDKSWGHIGSIFAWKIKDRPKHWKTYDLIAKVIITAGLAFLVITYTLPFTLDIPRLLTGTEERATVIIVSGYDYSKENEAVLPPLVRVQNVEDETEFRVYLFHGEIGAGEYIQIEYLPHSKHARVIQKDG